MKALILAATVSMAALAASQSAAQDLDLSIYTGYQTSPHSRASGDYPGGGSYDKLIGWEGKSFSMPIYYGIRGTWWTTDTLGFGLEFSHDKVYAPEDEREDIGFSRMELTDGLNIITVNAMKRWPMQWGKATPYVGGGLGISVPHVDVETTSGDKTFGYQLTGPAMRLTAGVSYPINDRFAAFGEYQFTYSSNEADLDGGGSMNVDIKTNALNVGITMTF